MKTSTVEQIETNAIDTPEWVTDLLSHTHGSQAFRQRCRDAALAAYALRRMRQEQEKIGFVHTTLGGYLRGLAEITKVSLQPLLRWTGIANLDEVSCRTAKGMARLGREVGLNLQETQIMQRIGKAESLGYESLQLAFARGERACSNELTLCDEELQVIESQYPLRAREELRHIVEITESEFASSIPAALA